MLMGIFAMFIKKVKNGMVVILFLLFSPFPDSLTGDGHFSRASNMMPFFFLTEGIGASYILQKFSKMKLLVVVTFAFVILISFTMFLISYFSYFPKYYSHFSQYGYEELSRKLKDKKEMYDVIYISRYKNDTKQYIYYLFYNKYDPKAFQSKKDVYYSQNNGWVSINKIENIYFVDNLPFEDELYMLNMLNSKRVLLISHPSEFPEELAFVDAIYDKNNNGVFSFVELSKYLDFLKIKKLNNE